MALLGGVDDAFLPALVVGGILAVLSLVLLLLDFGNRSLRALSLFTFLQGLYVGTIGVEAFRDGMRTYFLLALPFAAANFAFVFHQAFAPRSTRRPRLLRSARWALLLGALAIELAYLLDHSLYDAGDGFGPLYIMEPLYPLSNALLAALFFYAFGRVDGAARSSYFFASVAFALPPAMYATIYVADRLARWTSLEWGWMFATRFVLFSAAAAGAACVAVLLFRASHVVPAHRRKLRRAGILVGATIVYAAVIQWLSASPGLPLHGMLAPVYPSRAMIAIWNLALPCILAYAAVRHRFLNIDFTIRLAVKSGTIAACFVAAFFVAANLTEEYLVDNLGPVAGILASGLLVFAVHPLRRLGDRVAGAALPNAKQLQDMTNDERSAIYREQAEVAWMDGVLHRKERLLLDRLRDRLGIDPLTAAHLETSVVRGAVASDGGRRRSRHPRTVSTRT